MQAYQQAFVELLVEYEVVRFGDFTLKSGRRSPYFVNAGQLRTGDAIRRLGEAYAACITRHGLPCDLVFGPSYKGVPLAVATAIALSRSGADVGFTFDRKERKEHGEGGTFVGSVPIDGSRVILVDDVITSGISVRDALALLQETAAVAVAGVVVAVDRQERGQGTRTTLSELRQDLGIAVHPIVTIREIVESLHRRPVRGEVLVDDARREAVERYLTEFGAPD